MNVAVQIAVPQGSKVKYRYWSLSPLLEVVFTTDSKVEETKVCEYLAR